MSAKAALKAAKAAIDSKKYDKAIEEANKVIEADPKNYHANVFLGLALEKKERNDESEKAYRAATSIKPDEALAWQGLLTLYEKHGNKKLGDYAEAVRSLAQIFADAEDQHRCQTIVDKYLTFTKQHGTRAQLRHAYDLQVPGSPIYSFLEGRLPKPDFTYVRMVELIEAEEKETVSRLIAERRTRIGAKLGYVTIEVKKEVYATSDLEALYQGIIDYTHDDDLRRQFEEKLLQRGFDVLSVLPVQDKEAKLEQVQKLAEGMVIIKIPCELAWRIVLEWRDVESLSEWDVILLRQYVELLPEDGLSKVLRGFLRSDVSPFPQPEKEKPKEKPKENKKGEEGDGENDEVDDASLDPESRLYLMTEGLEESSRSPTSQRIMAEYYLHLEEWESAVEAARKALDLIHRDRKTTGLSFQNRRDGANIALATALVHYQTPRHHKEARKIFEGILARKSENVSAMIGIGLILEEEENFEAAAEFLTQAQERNPTTKIKSEASWCKALTGDYDTSLESFEECLEQIEQAGDEDKALKAEVLYRIGYCMWHVDTSKAARKDRTRAYARFLQCLQLDMNFAPAYTSLGIFYADYAKDRKRARKCFQKAFEMSPSETYAAERLARAFADSSEWELVEIVAQRVVDSGKVRPPPGSKRKAISWPHAALGICHLNNQEHTKAVPAFNTALRIDPDNYHCLVGLGESYHSSGRFIAAVRVFEEAKKHEVGVDPDEIWFAHFMLGSVHRDLGDYEEAIEEFSGVLSRRHNEYGVSIALLQTYVESAWHDNSLGLFGRSADGARRAIELASKIADDIEPTFNLLKSMGEACAIFAGLGPYAKELPKEALLRVLETGEEDAAYSHLSDVDKITLDTIKGSMAQEGKYLEIAVHGAVLAHKYGITVSMRDIHAQAVSWYNLGWSEYASHVTLVDGNEDSTTIRKSPALRAAVRCFKRAIELEAKNSEFWNALGIVTTPLNVRVAQHAFVRSLYLNERSPQVWTNLAVLYTLNNDFEIAREAFVRAQSTDPAYAPAWAGVGILALLEGNRDAARIAFTQAFEIGDSSSVTTKNLFATSIFDHISSSTVGYDVSDLLQPLFALYQLKTQDSHNAVTRHLLSLFAERTGDYAESVATLHQVSDEMEADYEVTESAESLARFAQAQADLARAYLAAGDTAAAIEHASTCLDLSEDAPSSSSFEPETRAKARLSAHLTAGLAHHAAGDQREQAIGMFRAALDESAGDLDVVCLLSQVLWAGGGAAERDVAREQLLDGLEKRPDHAPSIVLLAAIALLDDDAETIEAIAADLRALRTRPDLDERFLLKVGRLLDVFARTHPQLSVGGRADGKEDKESASLSSLAERAEAATGIMLSPHKPHGWAQMAAVAAATASTSDSGAAESASASSFPARMALLTATAAAPPNGDLAAEDLAQAHAGTHTPAGAQTATMLAPWSRTGWETLGRAARAVG